jgi:methylenetetrahydrofolate dehydrogenase (NADP+)/methenyltetrahydrofolate cyclohydrolase
MGAVILNGRERAAQIKCILTKDIASLKKKYKIVPGLAVILVGDHPASKVYVSSKLRQCQEVGIRSFLATFEKHTPEEIILKKIYQFNMDSNVHGILVQLPLPSSLRAEKILQAINPLKDVDGLHPQNLGALMMGNPHIVPCTPRGCLDLIMQYQKTLKGLYAVIVGRSILVGKSLALLLLREDCTVVIAHSKTHDLPEVCRKADILVAAAGYPCLVKKDWIKPGAIVIDVGINQVSKRENSTELVGDVDFIAVKEVAGAISPVPGGVGPMTVASLLQNTVDLMIQQLKI